MKENNIHYCTYKNGIIYFDKYSGVKNANYVVIPFANKIKLYTNEQFEHYIRNLTNKLAVRFVSSQAIRISVKNCKIIIPECIKEKVSLSSLCNIILSPTDITIVFMKLIKY